jgi:7-carboxy-7-deazaguanine synthase
MTQRTKNAPTARLIELFSAIQGEGLNVGTRQIFIRFAICDLRCHFCDSAHTWQPTETCQIEQTPGKRDFATYENPVTLTQLLEWVERLASPGLHDSISLTGGEPLLHAPFLQEFLPVVKERTGLPIYLETGGHRPEQLKMILSNLDSVGMDLKLPSVSGENCWAAHEEFLQVCHDAGVEVFVKIIISAQTNPQELTQAAELVAAQGLNIPVFLQPVTPLKELETVGGKHGTHLQQHLQPPSPEQVLEWQGLMKRECNRVRVVAQTHKMMGQM